jgi:hypothetical protein
MKVANAFSDSIIAEKLKIAWLSLQTVSRNVGEITDDVPDTLRWILLSRFGWQYRYHRCLPTCDICPDSWQEFWNQGTVPEITPTGTKGSYICYATNKSVYEFTSFEKCNVIVTDGAKSMVESKTVSVGHLKHMGVKCVLFIVLFISKRFVAKL